MSMQAGTDKAMSDINITPLVDVMLCLLIIFMVAAPMMEKERGKQEMQKNRDQQQRLIALNLPGLDNSAQPKPQSDTLVLKISNNLIVNIGKDQVADCSANRVVQDKNLWTPCFDAVEREIRKRPEATESGVTVDAETVVPFGFVVGVMHRLYKAKIQKVSMFPHQS